MEWKSLGQDQTWQYHQSNTSPNKKQGGHTESSCICWQTCHHTALNRPVALEFGSLAGSDLVGTGGGVLAYWYSTIPGLNSSIFRCGRKVSCLKARRAIACPRWPYWPKWAKVLTQDNVVS